MAEEVQYSDIFAAYRRTHVISRGLRRLIGVAYLATHRVIESYAELLAEIAFAPDQAVRCVVGARAL